MLIVFIVSVWAMSFYLGYMTGFETAKEKYEKSSKVL